MPSRRKATMTRRGNAALAVACGALAFGAGAIGAFAIGALAIRRLAIGRVAIGGAVLGDVFIRRLRVADLEVTGSLRVPPVETTPRPGL